jgi:hypothetical protein
VGNLCLGTVAGTFCVNENKSGRMSEGCSRSCFTQASGSISSVSNHSSS